MLKLALPFTIGQNVQAKVGDHHLSGEVSAIQLNRNGRPHYQIRYVNTETRVLSAWFPEDNVLPNEGCVQNTDYINPSAFVAFDDGKVEYDSNEFDPHLTPKDVTSQFPELKVTEYSNDTIPQPAD
jgi:hypothetical protein